MKEAAVAKGKRRAWAGTRSVIAIATSPRRTCTRGEIVGVPSAPVALSLSASLMHLGFSPGAFSLLHLGLRHLGFVGAAACELALLTLVAHKANPGHAIPVGRGSLGNGEPRREVRRRSKDSQCSNR
jgi:hypothetical protein